MGACGKGELRGETGRGIDMGEEAATGSGELGEEERTMFHSGCRGKSVVRINQGSGKLAENRAEWTGDCKGQCFQGGVSSRAEGLWVLGFQCTSFCGSELYRLRRGRVTALRAARGVAGPRVPRAGAGGAARPPGGAGGQAAQPGRPRRGGHPAGTPADPSHAATRWVLDGAW